MIAWKQEHDIDGVPTDRRRVEIDPQGWPGWRVALFRAAFAVSTILLAWGFAVWLFTTPWAFGCFMLAWCSLMGLALEEADSGRGGEDG